MAKVRLPFSYIRSLPPADQARLKRDFDAAYAAMTTMPFIVVASDGTGDFTSIAAAIASLPNGATNFSHLIYVKTSSTVYDDSALTSVDLGARYVTIMGQDSSPVGFQTDSILTAPQWKFVMLDNTTNTLGSLRIINMSLLPTQTGGLQVFRQTGSTGTGGTDFQFDHVTVTGSLFGTVTFGAVALLNDCFFSQAPFTDNITLFEVTFDRCRLDAGIAAAGTTLTLSNTGSRLRVANSRITQSTSFTIAFGNLGGERSVAVELASNRWTPTGTATITFTNMDNGVVVHVIGNSQTNTGTLTFTIAAGTSDAINCVFAANDMAETNIIITESAGSVLEGISISGVYRSISCAASGVQISATLDQRGVTSGTALTLSGSQNVAVVGIVPGTTTTGVNVSGNNNIIVAPNITNCTTPSINSGTGNSINGSFVGGRVTTVDLIEKDMLPAWLGGEPLPGVNSIPAATGGGGAPTGPAGGSLGGTYPNPTFAGRDTSVDKLNQDLLPSLLTDPNGLNTIPTPAPGSAPTGPAGGSLAGTYPNPTFTGRDASVDKLTQDLLPTLLGPSEGITAYPGPTQSYAPDSPAPLREMTAGTVPGASGGTNEGYRKALRSYIDKNQNSDAALLMTDQVFNGFQITDGVIAGGTPTHLTSASALFTAAMVGQRVICPGFVPAGTTVLTFNSTSDLTLSAAGTAGTALIVDINPLLKTTGVHAKLFTPRDNGGDTSAVLGVQTGGGGAGTFYKSAGLRPAGAVDYSTSPQGAVEAFTDGGSQAIIAISGGTIFGIAGHRSAAVYARIDNSISDGVLVAPNDAVFDKRLAYVIGNKNIDAAPTGITFRIQLDGSLDSKGLLVAGGVHLDPSLGVAPGVSTIGGPSGVTLGKVYSFAASNNAPVAL